MHRVINIILYIHKVISTIIGVSLSKPHIDHDNGPRTRNNGIYLSIYHLPHICCTLVPEIRVRPEMLCVFQYNY